MFQSVLQSRQLLLQSINFPKGVAFIMIIIIKSKVIRVRN